MVTVPVNKTGKLRKMETQEEKYKFAFILKKMKVKKLRIKDRTSRDLGHEHTTVHMRSERRSVQFHGDFDVICKWINGEFFLGKKNKDD